MKFHLKNKVFNYEEKMISKDNLEEQIHNISKQTIQKPKSLCKLIGMTLKNGEKALEYQLPSIT